MRTPAGVAFAAMLLIGISAEVGAAAAASAEQPAWVRKSNEHSRVLFEVTGRFFPEAASQLGIEGYDDQIIDLEPRRYQRLRSARRDALEELEKRLGKEADPPVQQDLEILAEAARDSLTTDELQHDLMVPYFQASRIAFGGIRALLDPRIAKERQQHAVTRLKRYAGLDGGTPMTQLARERTEERLSNSRLLPPYKGQVEQNLADTPSLVKGIRELFVKSGLAGYEEALAALEKQLIDYDAWQREKLLPVARTDHRLPPALYADNLKQIGVDIPPEQLMQRAMVAFKDIQSEMQTIAPLVAKQQGFKSTDYRDVIRELKKKQIVGKQILPLYHRRLAAIEAIIRRENIVTLPARKAVIRLASEAESAMQPAPNMRAPRLIGNQGEYGEFVLPLVVPGKAGRAALKSDDFTHDAATWTLTAHEARPGHELQYSAMVERGISTARAVFAANSVNVEGWGLYAEAEVKPFLPLEGQLITLQSRMKRAARAFVDPMVNLGLLSIEDARKFLMTEVMLSEAMAQQEVDRYSFRMPGQATSYFYGYQRLLETRQRAEIALRERFNRKAFNDFVLAQGLLPPRLLEQAVMDDFVKN